MDKNIEELMLENQMLRQEIKVAREAADITARLVVKQFEKTEQMLNRFQAANAQRQAVLDAATQLSIIATNLEGTITLFNRGASNLLGFSESEMVGKRNISSIHLPEELLNYANQLTGVKPLKPDAAKIFDIHVKQQISRTSEWTYICKDETCLTVNLSITAFYNAKGVMKGYLFTAMDMSSHKQMEYELIQAMKSAESANASKGDFLARMSHEIRTPMNGILGMTHLLRKTELDGKQGNYLDKILTSANTLLNLINDILDFSKIDAGKLELESIDFDLEDVLANLVNAIGLQAEEKGLEFLFQIDRNVPCKLKGDPLRLGQILMNLASNAVKFTEKGEIVISVALDDSDTENKVSPEKAAVNKEAIPSPDNSFSNCNGLTCSDVFLRFSVKDSGIGLNPEQIEFLFEAFSQADDSITRKYGGTGLGLSICSQLTDMMDGKIWAESTPGKGTTFTFTVKLQCSQTVKHHFLHHMPCQDIFRGRKALVVDDNKIARELLVDMLTSFQMDVDSAVDGQSALNCLEEAVAKGKPYDVVLLDWIMPGMNGIETARCIKANAAMANTPSMLMVTANGREEARTEAEKAGLNAFLLKPVYSSVMYETLLQTLGMDYLYHGQRHKTGQDITNLSNMKKIEGARVLLVEDNPINQEVALEFLKDAGIVTRVANNGEECLKMLDSDTFDLVLMDIQMPILDGLETTRIIRNQKKLISLPIIAMTAHAMAGDREKSIDAGMNGHLNKPVDHFELYKILQQFISDKKKMRELKKSCHLNPSFNPRTKILQLQPSQNQHSSPQ
ncbi:PAS domain-containing hybrid sensor histidine kinase/response regulator [Desulfamplus magnetovallimortis]|nr:response regulator [Desulfamplus magnetovallimortis]